MRLDKHKQWIGAAYAEDLGLMRSMLRADPSLADSSHEAFDDPFREGRFPVATLVFAVVGPPQQQINWRQVERKINFDMIKLLIEAGADPNIDNIHGRPLCLCREEPIVQYLIDNGGDINLWHDNGGAPVYFSVWQIDPERLNMQIRQGADACHINPHNSSSTLHSAAEVVPHAESLQDHLDTIHALAAAGVDPAHKAGIGVQSDWGPVYRADTPLHMAAARNTPNVIKTLLDIGCDPTLFNAQGETPFDIARREHRGTEIIELLTV
mgnify:CR=1 FL=1